MNVENISFQPGVAALKTISRDAEKTSKSDTSKINSENSFDSFYNTYLNIIKETNDYETQAQQIQVDYAAGKTDDMLSVMLAQEKAYTSLNFTVQVTNKIVEAYREIMRITL